MTPEPHPTPEAGLPDFEFEPADLSALPAPQMPVADAPPAAPDVAAVSDGESDAPAPSAADAAALIAPGIPAPDSSAITGVLATPPAPVPHAASPSAAPTMAAPRPRREIDYSAQPALIIRNLHKSFGAKHAVNDLSLSVPAGCLFGIVGPNGAGKTTTLSMATGLLRPDHGQIEVWGHDVWADPAKAKAMMGVLPDGLRLFDRLSGREMLDFVGQMRSLDPQLTQQRGTALLEALGLTADANTIVADYSAGMTKKIGLACALIHNPRLLVLDEPFEAVDPVSGQAIRSILNEFVNGGGTVVMSSHVMELVESLCDAVAVVAEGRILAVGELEQVRQDMPLQQRFLQLVGVHELEGGTLSWLGRSSDSN